MIQNAKSKTAGNLPTVLRSKVLLFSPDFDVNRWFCLRESRFRSGVLLKKSNLKRKLPFEVSIASCFSDKSLYLGE
jgi:hypothetical protein